MKNLPQSKNNSQEIVTFDLDSYTKLEQAELITRLTINANLDRNDTLVAMCCVSDLLYKAINQVQ